MKFKRNRNYIAASNTQFWSNSLVVGCQSSESFTKFSWKDPPVDWSCLGWELFLLARNRSFVGSINVTLLPSSIRPTWRRLPWAFGDEMLRVITFSCQVVSNRPTCYRRDVDSINNLPTSATIEWGVLSLFITLSSAQQSAADGARGRIEVCS